MNLATIDEAQCFALTLSINQWIMTQCERRVYA